MNSRSYPLFSQVSSRCARKVTLHSLNRVNSVNLAPAIRVCKLTPQPRNRVSRVNRVNLTSLALLLSALATPAFARDSLGMFSTWGAFRDPAVPRCYAIAMAQPSARQREYQPYAAIGSWPRRDVRGQVHFRLSRRLATNARIVLSLGGARFVLTGGGGDAWAADRRMDAAIVAAMRSAASMTVSARDAAGRGFSNTWPLAGAATAMDAAAIGCAQLR